MVRTAIIALCLLCNALSANSRTWTVERDGSGDFSTLHPAVTAAADGDTVLIGPGLYTEQVEFVSPGFTAPVNCHFEDKGLTLIGAGRGVTVINAGEVGKSKVVQDYNMVILSRGRKIEIRDLTMGGGFKGLELSGDLLMESVDIVDTSQGGVTCWESDLVILRECRFERTAGYAVVSWTPGIRVEMYDCHQVEGEGLLYLDGGGEGLAEDCTLQSCTSGFGVVHGSTIVIRRCQATDHQRVAVYAATGGWAQVYDCVVEGPGTCLVASIDGRVTGSGNELSSSVLPVLYGNSRGIIEIHECHLLRSGEAEYVDLQYYNPDHGVFYWDLTNNWWGTTDTAVIDEWIRDGHDDPSVSAFVLYEPFHGGPVSNEDMSWGGVKSLFR